METSTEYWAGVPASSWTAGGLGVLMVGIMGLQHVGRYHENWLTYRSAAELLKSEKHLRAVEAGPYARVIAANGTVNELNLPDGVEVLDINSLP